MQTLTDITKLTATRCCVCGKPLTDAESVEHGIGPVCSKRYYDPLHEPTQEMVMSALGLLLMSELPPDIITGFRKLVNNQHTNARLGSNLLVYYAACKYHDRNEVFKCSRIIRELGYKELADRLEIDRTLVTLLKETDKYLVAVPNRSRVLRSMMDIHGAEDTGTKQGHKLIWSVPLDQKRYLDLVLGVHLGGELACGTKTDGTTGVWKIARHRWTELRDYQRATQNGSQPFPKPAPQMATPAPKPSVLPSDALTSDNTTVYVKSPYNRGFLDALKNTIPAKERRWNPIEKRWEVKIDHKRTVRKLVLAHYYGIVI